VTRKGAIVIRLFAYPRVKSVVSVSDKVLKMTTSKELLNGFGKESLTVKAVAVYLGAEVRENQEGQFTHQLALLPSDRDPKGGIVSIKHNKQLSLEENTIYYIEAEASSARPDNHFGVSIYWLRNPKKVGRVSALKEVESSNG
jgi:hypothetical protein